MHPRSSLTSGQLCTLEVHLFGIQGLSLRDGRLPANAYVALQIGNRQQQTSVLHNSIGLSWNEKFTFHIMKFDSAELQKKSGEDRLTFVAWDREEDNKDRFLGTCTIDITGIPIVPPADVQRMVATTCARRLKLEKRNMFDSKVTGDLSVTIFLRERDSESEEEETESNPTSIGTALPVSTSDLPLFSRPQSSPVDDPSSLVSGLSVRALSSFILDPIPNLGTAPETPMAARDYRRKRASLVKSITRDDDVAEPAVEGPVFAAETSALFRDMKSFEEAASRLAASGSKFVAQAEETLNAESQLIEDMIHFIRAAGLNTRAVDLFTDAEQRTLEGIHQKRLHLEDLRSLFTDQVKNLFETAFSRVKEKKDTYEQKKRDFDVKLKKYLSCTPEAAAAESSNANSNGPTSAGEALDREVLLMRAGANYTHYDLHGTMKELQARGGCVASCVVLGCLHHMANPVPGPALPIEELSRAVTELREDVTRIAERNLLAKEQFERRMHMVFTDLAETPGTANKEAAAFQKTEQDRERDGVLFRAIGDKWVQRWCHLADGMLVESTMEMQVENVVPLLTATVREVPNSSRRFCFEVVSPTVTYKFQALSPLEFRKWIGVFENQIRDALDGQVPRGVSSFDFSQYLQVFDKIASEEGNGTCADCGTANPDWASVNLGILVCIQCSGIHRSLGTHLSKVRSRTLDTRIWTPELGALFSALGNRRVNSVLEYTLQGSENLLVGGSKIMSSGTPPEGTSSSEESAQYTGVRTGTKLGDNGGDKGTNNDVQKPVPSDSIDQKAMYIRAKYADRQFVHQDPHAVHLLSMLHSLSPTTSSHRSPGLVLSKRTLSESKASTLESAGSTTEGCELPSRSSATAFSSERPTEVEQGPASPLGPPLPDLGVIAPEGVSHQLAAKETLRAYYVRELVKAIAADDVFRVMQCYMSGDLLPDMEINKPLLHSVLPGESWLSVFSDTASPLPVIHVAAACGACKCTHWLMLNGFVDDPARNVRHVAEDAKQMDLVDLLQRIDATA